MTTPSPEEMERAMFETTYGVTESFEAIYRVDPISGGKRFQGTWLEKPDGSRFVITYRVDPDRFAFIDKRVVVTGKRVFHGPGVQQIMADHFAIESIELAPGETPYADVPKEIPPPPTVRDAAGLHAHLGRWVRMVGVVRSFDDTKSPAPVLFELPDGTQVSAMVWVLSEWSEHVGKKVTVITMVAPASSDLASDGEDAGARSASWEMLGPQSLCPGDVLRCGMTDTAPGGKEGKAGPKRSPTTTE